MPIEVIAARELAGQTQQEAAETVGIAKRTWQSYEWGERKMPVPTWELYKLKTRKK